MSNAYEALTNLTHDDIAAYSISSEPEKHIVIGLDRRVVVPEALKRIAVQYDHNIETVTFDCPRYWDDHDMSEMQVYINYILPGGTLGSYIADNVTSDEDVMHFDWTIRNDITQTAGVITFLVCVKSTDESGNEKNHWNSERCSDMYISEGLEGVETIPNEHPDIITQLLTRMSAVEEVRGAVEEAAESVYESESNASAILGQVKTQASRVSGMTDEVKGLEESAAKSAVEASVAAASQVGTKADAIVLSENGNTIVITDSSDDPLQGLRVMGRTEQVTTTGKNLIDMSGYEFNDSGYTHMLEPSSTSASEFYNFMRAHPGESIIYSMETTGTASGIEIGCIRFYGDGNILICALAPNTPHTIKADLPETFAVSYIYGSGTGASVRNIQVEFGTEVTSYEPYTGAKPSPNPEYPQDMSSVDNPTITVNGKNLFDMSKFVNTDTVTKLDDGTLSVSHYYNSLPVRLNEFAPGMVAGNSYRLTLDTDGCTFIYLNKYGKVWNSRAALLVTDDILDSAISVYGQYEQVDGSTIIRSIQITLDSMSSDYEEYKESQLMPVPYVLRGVPVTANGTYTDSNSQQWYCDEVDFERGVYIQRCFLETLKFTPQTELNRYSATISHRANPAVAIGTGIPVICSTYQFDPLCGSGSPTVNGIRIAATSPSYAIAHYDGEVIDEATVLYPLETPIEIELNADDLAAYKALHTNNPTTVILNSGNAMMYADYNADTKTYVHEAIDDHIETAMDGVVRYVGESVSPLSNGANIAAIMLVGGRIVDSKKGMLARYNNVVYMHDGSAWRTLQ